MKNHPPISPSAGPECVRAHKQVGIAFALACVLMLSGMGAGALPPETDVSAPGPASCQWLLTHDGERRGLVIESDLSQDAPFWELRANGHQGPSLATVQALCFGDPATTVGIAFNGGFWDEHSQPVGVCAGLAGIHAARSHRWGFAIGSSRAWIGHMRSTIRLTTLADNPSTHTENVLFRDVALNPRPLPRKAPCLIDTRTYPWPLVLPGPSRVMALQAETGAPLAYNTARGLIAGEIRQVKANTMLPDDDNSLTLIVPDADDTPRQLPPPGTALRLTLSLSPVEGPVRLVTCGWPQLLKDGHLTDDVAAMGSGEPSREARTAIGCDAEGRRLWVVLLNRGLDGRPGVTLAETARTLTDLGATDALNLDGGSSTQAWCPQLEPELSAFFPLRLPVHHALFLRRELIKKPSQP